jgi:hypothetical protein
MLSTGRQAAYEQLPDPMLREIEDQNLASAIETLSNVSDPIHIPAESPRGHRLGPFGVLSAIAGTRRTLDDVETVLRIQIRRLDTNAPIGQRPPTAAEVAWAAPGTQWTFPYPDGSGHVMTARDDDGNWTLFVTIYPQDLPALACPLPSPELSVPAEAERALACGSARPR